LTTAAKPASISLFGKWLRPAFDCGAVELVLLDWWQAFPGPCLYYSGGLVPLPLRAFIDFVPKDDAAIPSPRSDGLNKARFPTPLQHDQAAA
jgi:hypothetical protein